MAFAVLSQTRRPSMTGLGKNAIVLGVCAALAAFSGSLVGRLFLDVDEEDLYSLVPGVPTRALFSPELGDAFAFNLRKGRFEPTALCRLNVTEVERGNEQTKYSLFNDIGMSYNDVVKAANIEPGSFFFGVLGVKEASKEWVFERTFWRVSPQLTFEDTCAEAVHTKAQHPDFEVYLVESFEQEGPDPHHIKLVRVSETPIQLACDPECSSGSEPLEEVTRPGWAARIKRDWQLVRME